MSGLASRVASSRLARHNAPQQAAPQQAAMQQLDVFASIDAYRLPSDLRKKLAAQTDLLVAMLSSSADQLKAVGGERKKLTINYQKREEANETALARLPFQAIRAAVEAGKAEEMMMHDALTLLFSKNFLGFLLERLGADDAEGYRCVWASADLDNFKTVNDCWSHAHGDFAIILACRAIADEVAAWNERNSRVGRAVAMRFGGDEIVLAIVLRGSEGGAAPCRDLLDAVHARTCEKLQGRFAFADLDEWPRDRDGNEIAAKGPAISVGLSTALPCGKGEGTQYVRGFKRADGLLNDYKPKWKKGKGGDGLGAKAAGGGLIFEDDLLDAAAGDVGVHVQVLKSGTATAADKEKAAAALEKLTVNADNDVAIAKAGGLEALLGLLGSGTPVGKEKAASALWNLSVNAGNQVAIAKAGGLEALIELLGSGTPVGKEKAAGALKNLATNADNSVAIAKAGGLEALIELLGSGTPVGKERAASALGNLSNNADNSVAIAKAGGLAPLIELLGSGTPVGKEKAAGALWNLSVNADNKVAIAKAGGLEALIGLLGSGTPVSKEKAAAALKNLATNADNDVPIAKAGGLEALIELLGSGTPVGKEKAAGALWSLSANPDNKVAIAKAGGLEALIGLLGSGTPVGKEYAAAALKNLATNADNKVAIAKAGGLEALIGLLGSGTPVGKEKAAGALWNLSNNADNKVAIAKAGGLVPLIELLTAGRRARGCPRA